MDIDGAEHEFENVDELREAFVGEIFVITKSAKSPAATPSI